MAWGKGGGSSHGRRRTDGGKSERKDPAIGGRSGESGEDLAVGCARAGGLAPLSLPHMVRDGSHGCRRPQPTGLAAGDWPRSLSAAVTITVGRQPLPRAIVRQQRPRGGGGAGDGHRRNIVALATPAGQGRGGDHACSGDGGRGSGGGHRVAVQDRPRPCQLGRHGRAAAPARAEATRRPRPPPAPRGLRWSGPRGRADAAARLLAPCGERRSRQPPPGRGLELLTAAARSIRGDDLDERQ